MLSRGVLYMVLGTFWFATGAMVLKLAGESMDVTEIAFVRFVVNLVLCWYFLRKSGVNCFGNRRGLLLFRGGIGSFAVFLTFSAFIHLPMADAATLTFVYPVIVAVLAGLILKEHLNLRMMLGIVVSIGGVLLVVQPTFLFGGGHELNPVGVTYALGAAVGSALAVLSVRVLTKTEHPLVIIFYQAAVGMLFIPWLGAWKWTWPSPYEALLLFGVALFMYLGQVMMTKSYALEPAAKVSSIGYLEIVYAAIWGIIVFGDIPGLVTICGAALVIGGTLVVGKKEKTAEQE